MESDGSLKCLQEIITKWCSAYQMSVFCASIRTRMFCGYVACHILHLMLCRYNRITSTMSPLFCTTTFSASLTNLTTLLPQSRVYSCYVSRPILAPPPLWLQKHTDLRAHDFAHSPGLWHQPRIIDFTSTLSLRLCGINPPVPSIGLPCGGTHQNTCFAKLRNCLCTLSQR
jgi:hypothetical protein